MSKELTFMHQQVIDELSKKANKRSSNQNKYRYDLYAYIQSLIDGKAICRSCLIKTNIDYSGVCPSCR